MPPEYDIALEAQGAVAGANLYLVNLETVMSQWRSCESLSERLCPRLSGLLSSSAQIGGGKCNSGSVYVVRLFAKHLAAQSQGNRHQNNVQRGLERGKPLEEGIAMAAMSSDGDIVAKQESGWPNSGLTRFPQACCVGGFLF